MVVQAVGSLPWLYRLYNFFNGFTGCRIFAMTVQVVGVLP